MYNINHKTELGYIEIENAQSNVYAKIFLNLGASLQELTLNGHKIIKDLSPLSYDVTYASSILFPFANRIKDGKYSFKGKNFQFETNQKEENNALHGLVFNKTFNVIEKNVTTNSATVVLEYNETNTSKGFPYTYNIKLEYIFSKENLELKITVKNTDSKAFPFTLGWHPYFISDNLFESSINLNSSKKVVLGDRNITTGTKDTDTTSAIKIQGQQLDDCWILDSDEVVFKTPKYNLKFNATGDNNFIQLYTPPKENTIAIEPTTGVSDSFNNEIGLKTLDANNTFSIAWSLNIEKN